MMCWMNISEYHTLKDFRKEKLSLDGDRMKEIADSILSEYEKI